jgi:hypothetical protein
MKTFDEVFDTLDDFSICNAVSGGVEDRYGYWHLMTWPTDVPTPCKVTHYIWSTTGFLECEGYARFFTLVCDHDAFPSAMDAIGMTNVAQSIRHALSLVPQECLGNKDKIIEHFGSWDALRERVDSHEDLLFSSSKPIEVALAVYVRFHKEAFRELEPFLNQQNDWRSQE